MTNKLDQQLLQQYEQHQTMYDTIQTQLNTIHSLVLSGPDEVAKTLLHLSDVFAILSVQTHVTAHELGYTRVLGQQTAGEIAETLADVRGPNNQVVQFYNNKADYIVNAIREVDYDHQLQLFRSHKYDELHRWKVDNVDGLRMAKSAFSLAMVGVGDRMCVDSNVARFFGHDPDTNILKTVDVERYQSFCDDLAQQAPSLDAKVSRFLYQWIAFDVARNDGIATHDPYFLTVEETIGESLPTIAQV